MAVPAGGQPLRAQFRRRSIRRSGRGIGLRIGIIGAGLCGLASAALLAARGHEVEVLERAAEPRPLGAGLLLQPPGAAILRAMGVELPDAARITRLDSRAHSGATLIDLDYADLSPGLHGLGIGRGAIWAALLEAASRAGAALHPGCEVAAVEDGAAILGSGARRQYELLVIAAGSHAPFWGGRRGHAARRYPWGCLWATIPLPAEWPRDVLTQRCRGTRFMAGILPTGRDVAALYWSVRNEEVAAWRAAPIAAWRATFERVWPEAAPLVAHVAHADFEHATYRDVRADPPHEGRTLLIGDAAHGTSPQLGQGTTQALRDALALAETLDAGAPLDAYWAARRDRVRYYRLASRALTPVFQSAIPGLGVMRDLFAGPVGRIPFIRHQALLTLAGMKTGLFSADQP